MFKVENEKNELLYTRTHPIIKYFKKTTTWEIVENHSILKAFNNNIDYCEGECGNIYFNIKSEKLWSALNPNISELLEHVTPSYFGRGNERVYDEMIRKGLDIKNLQSNEPRELQETIKPCLFPTAPDIEIVFSKMAIYQPGGHFDVHRDHVINHDHQGTLLVEVRSQHTGGDLVLCHNGVEHRWSLQQTPGRGQSGYCTEMKCNSLRYIAFYTDIPHRVEPVLSGTRIVLQYDIFIKDLPPQRYAHKKKDQWEVSGWHSDHHQFPRPISEQLTSNLINDLQSLVNDQQGIAIPLFHLYTDAELPPNRLKLKDAQVFYSLMKHGYCVQLVPITIIQREDYRAQDHCDDSESDNEQKENPDFIPGFFIEPCPVLEQGYRIQFNCQEMNAPATNLLESLNLECYPIRQLPKKITYIATGYEQVLYLHSILGGANIGNEPDTRESRYFCVVFLITTSLVVQNKEQNDDDDDDDDEV